MLGEEYSILFYFILKNKINFTQKNVFYFESQVYIGESTAELLIFCNFLVTERRQIYDDGHLVIKTVYKRFGTSFQRFVNNKNLK